MQSQTPTAASPAPAREPSPAAPENQPWMQGMEKMSEMCQMMMQKEMSAMP